MRLLLVEDDPTLGTFLESALKKETYAVDLVRDGEQGSFLARTNKYEVIVLDFLLPKLDGQQVLKEIREDGNETPIIAISSRDKLNDRLAWLEAGADDYLIKPFALSELLARIKAIRRRRSSNSVVPTIINYQDLKINLSNFEVFRGNKKIKLTSKEFSLLKFLMTHPGQVLSREIIMENVWDMNADPFSNTVETHIMRLRQKIEQGGKRLIHTISGRGYKLDVIA